MWIAASFLHLVIAGIAALFVAVLRIDPADLDNQFFQQAVTLRSIGGAFLFLLPLTIGIATVVASGNSGATNGLGVPACIADTVSVGATYSDRDAVWPLSKDRPVVTEAPHPLLERAQVCRWHRSPD